MALGGKPDLEIKVGTQADTSGLEKARKSIRGVIDDFKAAPGAVGKWNVAWSAAAAAVTAFTAALLAALATAKKVFNEFGDGQERMRSLASVIANNGELTRAYIKDLAKLAGTMERATAIADDEWMAVLEELSKHGANPENIERYTQAVSHLAGMMGKDGNIHTAAQVLTRAMEGNFMVLRRLGIEIDETGSRAEQLESILRQLAERGAGILEQRAIGLNGDIKELGLAFNNLAESVGALLNRTRLLAIGIQLPAAWFRKLADMLPEVEYSLDGIENKQKKTNKALTESGDAAATSAKGIGEVTSSLNTLKDAYDAAAKAADGFRRQQDESLDRATKNKLAEIDLAEAQGIMNPDDARLAKAAILRAGDAAKANAAISDIDAQTTKLRQDESGAFNQKIDAEEAAARKVKERDTLIDYAVKAGLGTKEELLDPKKLEAAIGRLKSTASGSFPRPGIAGAFQAGDYFKAGGLLGDVQGLPTLIAEAAAAQKAADEAASNYQSVFSQTSPRREQLERARTAHSMDLTRFGMEARTEALNVMKNPSGGPPTQWNALPNAAGIMSDMGGEIRSGAQELRSWGKAVIQDTGALLSVVKELKAESAANRKEIYLLKQREGHNRNR